MKRILVASLLCTLAAPIGVLAQSWDLTLDSSLSATQLTDFSVSATESANFSAVVPLGQSLKFSTKLMAKLVTDYSEDTGLDNSNPIDIQDILPQEFQLQYGAPFPDEGIDQVSFQVGRLPYADPTGAVFTGKLDGASFTFTYPKVSLWAVVGYTGYIPQADDSFVLGAADYVYGTDGFAPPRAVASFGLKSPKFFGNELFFGFIAQEDMRNDEEFIREYETVYNPLGGGAQDSAYLTAGTSGTIGTKYLYTAYGVYQFGRSLSYVDNVYSYEPVRALSLGAAFRINLPPRLTGTARVQYGTGDADADAAGVNTKGRSTYFFPITKSSPGLVFAPQAGNIGLLEVGVNYTPNPGMSIGPKAMQIGAKLLLFIKAGEGPTSESSVDAEAGAKLLGIEQDTTFTLRLLSDLTFNLSAGLFLPFADPMGAFPESYSEGSPLKYTVRAGMSLAL